MQDVLIQSWTLSQLKTWKCVVPYGTLQRKCSKLKWKQVPVASERNETFLDHCLLYISNIMWYNTKVSIWMRSSFGEACRHTGAFTSAVAETFSPHFHFLFHFHLTFIVSVQKLKLAFHLIRTNIVEMISWATQPQFSSTLLAETDKSWWKSKEHTLPMTAYIIL